MRPAALLLAVLAARALAETPPDQPSLMAPGDVGGWHFAGLPLVSYTSDVGLTLGAALFFYRDLDRGPDEPPAQQTTTLSLTYSTRGPRSIDLGWGRPTILGPLGLRLNVHLADDPRMPYWGEGAQLGGLSTPPGYGTPPEPYRYHDRRAFLAAVLQGPIAGPVGWHMRLRYLAVGVAHASDLLASSAPPGAEGAQEALGELGLLYDTRDRPLGPRSGVLATVAGFVAPRLGGLSSYAFHGWDASVRGYLPLVPGITLAARALYDLKLPGLPWGTPGDREAVPYFERMLYEGLAYDEGLGGASTIRGIARYRVSGDEKMLLNVQVRMLLFTLHLFDKTQELGLSAGADAGRARQPGYAAVDAVGYAGGLRLVWDRAVVLRVEMARAVGGDSTLYIAFGEQF